MTIPVVVQNQMDASWWMFIHVTVPVVFIGVVIAGIITYIYQTYYDNGDE